MTNPPTQEDRELRDRIAIEAMKAVIAANPSWIISAHTHHCRSCLQHCCSPVSGENQLKPPNPKRIAWVRNQVEKIKEQ